MVSELNNPAGQRDRLLSSLGITPADLLANRAGVLTAAQQRRIRDVVRPGRFYAIAVFGSLLATGVLLIFSLQGDYSVSRLIQVGGWLSELGLAWVVVSVLSVLPLHRSVARLCRGRVYSADGVVRRIAEDQAMLGSFFYVIKTGDLEFYVQNERPMQGFIRGARYRFYYILYADRPFLVAAEPVGMV